MGLRNNDMPFSSDEIEEELENNEKVASTAVVPQSGPKSPANMTTSSEKKNSLVASVLSKEEIDSLDLGYGAFPIITLDKGEFECSEGYSLGTSFDAVIMDYKDKYFYRTPAEGQNPTDFFYTMNKETTLSGDRISDILQEWGTDYSIKEYKELTVQLVGGPQDGKLALVSVSPTSKPRFGGYVLTLASRGYRFDSVITTIRVGEKVTKAKFPFKPFDFVMKAPISS